ncbi:hypothetical protein NEOLI_003122 [Neolecta irregularis DAH-3]|uniref:Uncharacterized protein n=1 Tax=Neolecta irregularis (strain DAH-3) TaxID=1198029 RepID=A0A1U7LN76_NEOID|nr:hypothetical protein NEOLI_003122 [Neolecta irregularis DAH-3]|eukprot:OLL24078.1 hypothetical protein NEOLI_003122 [Neolecta irregularis DAH-3]
MDPRTRKDTPEDPNVAIFKQAACNVTQLFLAYKTAAADHSRAREDGYAEALADMLVRLDSGVAPAELRAWIVQCKREGSAESTDEHMAAAEKPPLPPPAAFTFTAPLRSAAPPAARSDDLRPDVGELLFEYIKNNTNTPKRRLQDRGYAGAHKRGRFQ